MGLHKEELPIFAVGWAPVRGIIADLSKQELGLRFIFKQRDRSGPIAHPSQFGLVVDHAGSIGPRMLP